MRLDNFGYKKFCFYDVIFSFEYFWVLIILMILYFRKIKYNKERLSIYYNIWYDLKFMCSSSVFLLIWFIFMWNNF